MINGKLEISVIEGRGFDSSSKKYVKFSIPSTSVKSLAKSCDKEGSVSWNVGYIRELCVYRDLLLHPSESAP